MDRKPPTMTMIWATTRRTGASALAVVALWLVLTGADPALLAPGLLIGAAAGIAAVLGLSEPAEARPGVVRCVLWAPGFLWRTLAGAIDVTVRILKPSLPVQPHFIEYKTRLPPGWPRTAFVSITSLMPGSLAAGASGERIRVHLLSDDPHLLNGLEEEERRISEMTPDADTAAATRTNGDRT